MKDTRYFLAMAKEMVNELKKEDIERDIDLDTLFHQSEQLGPSFFLFLFLFANFLTLLTTLYYLISNRYNIGNDRLLSC